MFFKFHDSTINIIDSRYLIWDQNNNENYMIQVEEKVENKTKYFRLRLSYLNKVRELRVWAKRDLRET